MKKSANLNMEIDRSKKLWRLPKQLNDEEIGILRYYFYKTERWSMGNKQPIPTKKQGIYQLSYTNKNMCAQNRERLLSLLMCQQ